MKKSLSSPTRSSLEKLLQDVRACRFCEADLPLGPKPVLRVESSARILVASQAPGIRVHQSGLPFDDPSGDRLRAWMKVTRETFYDSSRIAIIPMGYCYPGKGPQGDLPPRRECAELWLDKILALLPNVRLTLLVGNYAQRHYLHLDSKATLTRVVKRFRDYAPKYFPLPHPSPRNFIWFLKNPWFEKKVLPDLRTRVRGLLEAT